MVKMKKGYQIIVLHAHLPYVRHKGYSPAFIEENWLNEAINETYIPLLKTFRTLKRENVPFKITMSFTPTLISMLKDKYLQDKYLSFVEKLIELANKEVKRTTFDPHLNYLSNFYLETFEENRNIFLSLDKDIISGFQEFHKDGSLEVITCAATHGFLPLLESEPSTIRAQLSLGRRIHRNTWGVEPRGIWLPECGYYKGLEKFLSYEGFRYFIVDSHGVKNANPRPKFGVHAPVEIGSGIFAFPRDPQSSAQVWSAKEGYPGDYRYREYYRDIGFDLDYDYVKDYIHPDGIRHNTGIKYHCITGKTDYKEYYHPDWAIEAAGNHAEDFMRSRIVQSQKFFEEDGQPAVIVSPYDAELFGHWWYEGPKFLEFLFKKIHFDQSEITTIHPMQILGVLPRIQSVEMDMCSWGEGGYADVWLNPSNEWIYPHIMECSISMNEMTHLHFKTNDEVKKRILNQMAREVLLLQSSDWPFIIKTGTTVSYAQKRIKVHTNLFLELKKMLETNEINLNRLAQIEAEHPIFPEISYEIFA
jgi:1,4-alpha-glucan branching enzyme